MILEVFAAVSNGLFVCGEGTERHPSNKPSHERDYYLKQDEHVVLCSWRGGAEDKR